MGRKQVASRPIRCGRLPRKLRLTVPALQGEKAKTNSALRAASRRSQKAGAPPLPLHAAPPIFPASSQQALPLSNASALRGASYSAPAFLRAYPFFRVLFRRLLTALPHGPAAGISLYKIKKGRDVHNGEAFWGVKRPFFGRWFLPSISLGCAKYEKERNCGLFRGRKKTEKERFWTFLDVFWRKCRENVEKIVERL